MERVQLETLRKNKLAALILLLAIGHVHWIKFEFPALVYPLDYVGRIVIIALCYYVYQFCIGQFLGWRRLLTWRNTWLTGFAAAVILISFPIIDIVIHLIDSSGIWRWRSFPRIDDPYLKAFDLTIGLALVALSEELVYRKLMVDVLARWQFRPASIYIISSLLFAALHVYQSAGSTTGAFVAGLILMYVYQKSSTLWVPIAAHYVANLYFFGIG